MRQRLAWLEDDDAPWKKIVDTFDLYWDVRWWLSPMRIWTRSKNESQLPRVWRTEVIRIPMLCLGLCPVLPPKH
jgi:hypothetical protein